MKINLFDLQIFAEPNGNSEPNGNNIEPNTGASGTAVTEPNEDNKPQPKYTDEDLDRIIQEKKAKWDKQAKESEEEAKKLVHHNGIGIASHTKNKASDLSANLTKKHIQ